MFCKFFEGVVHFVGFFEDWFISFCGFGTICKFFGRFGTILGVWHNL